MERRCPSIPRGFLVSSDFLYPLCHAVLQLSHAVHTDRMEIIFSKREDLKLYVASFLSLSYWWFPVSDRPDSQWKQKETTLVFFIVSFFLMSRWLRWIDRSLLCCSAVSCWDGVSCLSYVKGSGLRDGREEISAFLFLSLCVLMFLANYATLVFCLGEVFALDSPFGCNTVPSF